ncbi:hypothetical protein QAD02_021722 [Eretmocerus hayati]|uniref:Uncharacterized protein n=1 Tax=Eretmocerus hayati TaxID=131215 RepID=A0ACC2PQQ6_9HYME|nr:hypothetical protein QAD02_021722 [Eretmocerus hayati]
MDPFDKKSQPLVALAESLYSYSVPLRLGFVLVTNPSVMGTTFNIDAAVNDMFYFVLESRGPKDALSLLSRVSMVFSGTIDSFMILIRDSINIGRYLCKNIPFDVDIVFTITSNISQGVLRG